jgi:hypothetical protein
MMEPVPLLTVGDLKSELSRWSNETPVTFYSPLGEQEFRFYRYRPGDSVLVLEINEFPETPQVLPRHHSHDPDCQAIGVQHVCCHEVIPAFSRPSRKCASRDRRSSLAITSLALQARQDWMASASLGRLVVRLPDSTSVYALMGLTLPNPAFLNALTTAISFLIDCSDLPAIDILAGCISCNTAALVRASAHVAHVNARDPPLTRPASEFQLTRSPILKVLVMTARFNQNKLPHRFGEALVLIAVGHRACLCLHLVA